MSVCVCECVYVSSYCSTIFWKYYTFHWNALASLLKISLLCVTNIYTFFFSGFPIQFHWSMCLLNWFSHVQLFATPWTVARQAPLSMGFSRQEYWSELPCPLPGDLPGVGACLSLSFLHWQVGSLRLAPPGKPFMSIFTPITTVLIAVAL